MKRIRLTKEEKEIEDSLLRGEYVKVTGAELKEISSSLAARKKDMMMTIRVNSTDIKKIKITPENFAEFLNENNIKGLIDRYKILYSENERAQFKSLPKRLFHLSSLV